MSIHTRPEGRSQLPQGVEDGALPEASEFTLLLEESSRLAEAEGIGPADLEEMDAINQMRIVAESISTEEYVFYSGV